MTDISTLKKSKQRDAILAFLSNRKDHPTADTVYMNVKNDFPSISLGTVYRNLTQLSDLGIIGRINMGGTLPDRFDPNPEPHLHFLCRGCGCLSDLDVGPLPDLAALADEHFDGRIDSCVTLFYGYCEKCLAMESGLS